MALTLPATAFGGLCPDLLGQKEQELAMLRQQALQQLQQQVPHPLTGQTSCYCHHPVWSDQACLIQPTFGLVQRDHASVIMFRERIPNACMICNAF